MRIEIRNVPYKHLFIIIIIISIYVVYASQGIQGRFEI